jgi:hypothetical protein
MQQMPMIASFCRRRNNSHGPIEIMATMVITATQPGKTRVIVQICGHGHFGNVKAFMQRPFDATQKSSRDLSHSSPRRMEIR